MRKTDKKLDNQLRVALTEVCEYALKEVAGFQWVTHLVNYAHFPKSLKVVCVFDSNENLHRFMATASNHELNRLIQKKLFGIGINISSISDHVLYDTEDNYNKKNSVKSVGRRAK
ncbi:putative transcriptional regulator, fis family protein [Psychromonas ingrahamii 37]|uniref:Putative transcriptional regulator, fis family protein n=1 Tax=Psychromonas ingrahamii (strain DSM 17664 / CCUG 51855 / 37) TaxID=357804 RepID=A1SVJ1_PSYIN|nr:hypothetical protein [Psychromonas ingrahamii]ABM03506.1 putative transcriptional regulator, fis family protein [Psychromonas ingrahamii 37]